VHSVISAEDTLTAVFSCCTTICSVFLDLWDHREPYNSDNIIEKEKVKENCN